MKTRILMPLLAAVLHWLATGSAPAASDSNSLCVVSYNLRYASPSGPNSWPERRPLIREVVRTLNPDLMGTQEGVHQQLLDIAADLPEYDWIGTGREGGNRGEFMAVFYRKSRFQPVATNHFWLSDTPEVPASTTWGNSVKRMVTRVQFQDRQTGIPFHFVNTHFDHQVQEAREKSAALVRSRIEALGTNLPVILTGDFNADAGKNRAYSILTEKDFLKDTWTASPRRVNEGMGTFNGFRSMPTNGPRIDWILTRGAIRVDDAEIVTLKPGDHWASDHLPILARIRFE